MTTASLAGAAEGSVRTLRSFTAELVVGAGLVLVPFFCGIGLGLILEPVTVSTPGQATVGNVFSHNLGIVAPLLIGCLVLGVMAVMQIPSWFAIGLTVGAAGASGRWEDVVKHVLPHAVPELAAACLASAVSVALVRPAIRWLRGSASHLAQSVRFMTLSTLASVALLLVAAVVEGTISK